MLRSATLAASLAGAGLLAAAGCGPAAGGAGGVPAWPDTLAEAAAFGAPRGWIPARALVHVHSVYSHDACDGEPQDDQGRLNESCLRRFRRALCTANIDAAFLTEHDRWLVRADSLVEALLMREGDEPVHVDGHLAASRMTCGTLLFVGAENLLMPVAFDSLPAGTHEERRAVYEADSAGATELFHSYGAVVLLSHPEELTLARIRALAPDGIEVYNPHANFAPQHRPAQDLSRFGAIQDILPFYARTTDAHPDLALLPIFHANHAAIRRWDALLAGDMVFGFGASDAHENSLPWGLADGDRGDAYQRLIPWVTNALLLAADTTDPGGRAAAIEDALREGRFYVTIEAWGTPAGFDFRLEGPTGVVEMGGRARLAEGQRLVVEPPGVAGRAPALPRPGIRMRLYRIDASGARTIAAESATRIVHSVRAPGAYRVEVEIVPHHLEPYLGRSAGRYLRPVVWIYSNPIYVVAPPGSALAP